jgi:hypothetical protein
MKIPYLASVIQFITLTPLPAHITSANMLFATILNGEYEIVGFTLLNMTILLHFC